MPTNSNPVVNEGEVNALYAKFADDDGKLAEEGIDDYGRNLTTEDITQRVI
jgi:hypothetical protein